MARTHSPTSGSDSDSSRRAIALVAAVIVAASVGVAGAAATAVPAADAAAIAGNADSTTAGNDDPATVTGRVVTADGAPAAGDLVRLDGADRNRTDDRGRYRLGAEADRRYDLTYRQRDADARDGVPDVYAAGRVGPAESSERNVTLPSASPVNLTVVARNGTAVGDAAVRMTHERDGANATVVGRTDERGRLTVDGRLGVDLAGTVTVAVDAPDSSLRDNTTRITVTEPTDSRIALPLNDTTAPTLRYDVSPRTADVNETVAFDARNATDASGIERTTWIIRGQPTEARQVGNAFEEPGNYSVTLRATDWAGNRNETEINATVADGTAPNATLAVAPENATTNESVRFDAGNSTDNHRIDTYRWDVDGDGEIDATTNDSALSHTYAERGRYDVTVEVVDEAGYNDTATRTVAVERPSPNASFTVSERRPEINETVRFDATPSSVPGNETNYTWRIDDGRSVRDEVAFSTSFADSGTYAVTLTVTAGNRSDERTRTVEVPNDPPAAEARADGPAIAGETVELDASWSTDPHDDLAFDWSRTAGPNASLSNATASAPTFVAPDVNETTALRFGLTVTDDHGGTDTDSVAVAVAPAAPPNVSYAPARPAVGEAVTFRANRTGAFSWRVGNESLTATGENATATRRFDEPGTYEVRLTDSVNRTVARSVTVTEPPEATADAPTEVTAGERAVLDGTAAGGGLNRTHEWTQTGGPNATLSNATAPDSSFVAPNVTAPRELTFAYRLTGGGGADTATVTVSVVPEESEGSDDPENSTSRDSGSAGSAPADTGGSDSSSAGSGAAGSGASGSGSSGDGSGDGGGSGATGGGASAGSAVGGGGASGSSDAGSDGASASSQASSGGGSSPSVDSGGSDDAPAKPARPSVTVERANETDSLVAAIAGATGGERARIAVPDGFGANGSAFEALSVDAGAPNVSLSIAFHAERPDGVPKPDADALSYLEVDEREAGSVESARIRFRVEADALDRREVAPESVTLHRYADGEWETLSTEHVRERDGTHLFEAVSPGFSVFAIGAEPVDLTVTDAALGASAVPVGERVLVTATVANPGSVERTSTVHLLANGTAIADRRVEIPPNGSRVVSFARSFDSAGSVAIAVENASAGLLSVLDPGAPETAPGDGESGQDQQANRGRATDGSDAESGDSGGLYGISSDALTIAMFLFSLVGAGIWGHVLSGSGDDER